jgi:hypothetical protein
MNTMRFEAVVIPELPEKEDLEYSHLLVDTFTKGLSNGVMHFRKSDGKELGTVLEILEALNRDGEVEVVFPE